LLYHAIKTVFMKPIVVAVALILGGIAILVIERKKPEPQIHAVEQFTPALSAKIGLFQCLALVPGVSRSGATIMGALLMKVDRQTATIFSFFLAIPTMLGATVFDLAKNHAALSGNDWGVIATGFLTAMIVGWLVVRWFIRFVGTHSFSSFAWYRIILGVVIIAALLIKGM
jgi:undecaprenyl-diphosphatase